MLLSAGSMLNEPNPWTDGWSVWTMTIELEKQRFGQQYDGRYRSPFDGETLPCT